ncbi:hypothetical protein [Microbacterium kyungheense]|uniref:Uncharacterized protein n=1 Tax=Microbacterium kyungheense TaxID=1263636 RepID=A0A543EAF8_9MICO|nr:hypothetical protein [Microbacterium kyungheense]TQM18587.1 hypothetical protein FB391_3717 [Microbacterium kyungheense]
MSAGRRVDLADEAALARYLVAMRDSGPGLTPELAAAFDELTPAQLDVLVGLLVDGAAQGTGEARPDAPASATPAKTTASHVDAAPPADRAPWSLRAWAALLVGASLVTGALVWAATVAIDGPSPQDSTSVVAERGEAPVDPGDLGIDVTGLDAWDW